MPAEVKGDEITISQGDRRYRVRGLAKNMSYELLKVNVLVYREPSESVSSTNESGFHVDTFDLYSARQRTVFGKQASEELGVKEEVIRRDLGHVLLKLEELQEQQIKKALEPKRKKSRWAKTNARRRWNFFAIPTCSTVSWRTSSTVAWWEKKSTNW